jgi:UrcA family protein
MKLKTNRCNVITLTLTSLLGFGAAMAATDARAANQPSILVSYQDLDLARPADAQRLYQRIEHAAAAACSDAPPAFELARHLAWSRCYDAAVDSAVLQVRSPELLAIYRSSRAQRPS